MRENMGLYRGKRIGGGFICGCLIIDKGAKEDQPRAYILQKADYGSFAEFVATEVDPETVGECSGVPDENGTLMYEGDVVKGLCSFGCEVLSVVAFKDGAFGLARKRGNSVQFTAFTSICNTKYEIIGNIYDNPELLEAADE